MGCTSIASRNTLANNINSLWSSWMAVGVGWLDGGDWGVCEIIEIL